LPELLRIRRQLGDRLIAERPSLFVGFDAPDFNFGLETRLREAGLKTVHFVCPSIWAWRAHRVHLLARAADHVLCLFPFEPALLRQHGIEATFVGHPLADLIPKELDREAARTALGLHSAPDAPIVALLPGSRRSEIRHIAPVMLAAAALMQARWPGLQFVMPVVPGLRPLVEPLLAQQAPSLPVKLLDGRAHEALAACDVTVVASGTATLEAALFKCPMVITYKLGALDWWRMRRMALQPWFGLPNILSEAFVVPELIQDGATPEALAAEALAWLDDPERVAALRTRFEALHDTLRQNTAARTAEALQQLLDGAPA
jgi:lipid-A-disaccharide synthase